MSALFPLRHTYWPSHFCTLHQIDLVLTGIDRLWEYMCSCKTELKTSFKSDHGVYGLSRISFVLWYHLRLVVKRYSLSNLSFWSFFRIFTKSAIIRYMFFNRQDIEWFKPVELRTKWGRRGHIQVSYHFWCCIVAVPWTILLVESGRPEVARISSFDNIWDLI